MSIYGFSGSASQSVSRLFNSLQDINGDGFPDLLESESDDELCARLNRRTEAIVVEK
ncbi:MAG: hypothetical protein PUG15_03980 [Bacteroidales bacterium]|nr:hypothetical protein [Bacteroidales bacterium]